MALMPHPVTVRPIASRGGSLRVRRPMSLAGTATKLIIMMPSTALRQTTNSQKRSSLGIVTAASPSMPPNTVPEARIAGQCRRVRCIAGLIRGGGRPSIA